MYRILVVDDEPIICKGLSKTIGKAEHIPSIIQTAANGIEALEIIQTMNPHFVFTDIRMPKMDGLELCRHISENYPSILLVVVSGYGEFEYAQKSIGYGVLSYILKPITKKSVHETLDHLVTHYRTRNQSTLVSPLSIEAWVKKMVDAIWMLHTEELLQLLKQWENELNGHQLGIVQLRILLSDFFEMLVKQLTIKGMETNKINFSKEMLEKEDHPLDYFGLNVQDSLTQLREKRKGKSKDMIEEAKKYIELNLSKEVSLEEVADILGLNPSYFSQYFKLKTNETFVHYRITRRMEKAKRLLEIPHYRVTDISHEIGYADHPHFTKTFKKHVGVSPSEYRKMLGIQ